MLCAPPKFYDYHAVFLKYKVPWDCLRQLDLNRHPASNKPFFGFRFLKSTLPGPRTLKSFHHGAAAQELRAVSFAALTVFPHSSLHNKISNACVSPLSASQSLDLFPPGVEGGQEAWRVAAAATARPIPPGVGVAKTTVPSELCCSPGTAQSLRGHCSFVVLGHCLLLLPQCKRWPGCWRLASISGRDRRSVDSASPRSDHAPRRSAG